MKIAETGLKGAVDLSKLHLYDVEELLPISMFLEKIKNILDKEIDIIEEDKYKEDIIKFLFYYIDTDKVEILSKDNFEKGEFEKILKNDINCILKINIKQTFKEDVLPGILNIKMNNEKNGKIEFYLFFDNHEKVKIMFTSNIPGSISCRNKQFIDKLDLDNFKELNISSLQFNNFNNEN